MRRGVGLAAFSLVSKSLSAELSLPISSSMRWSSKARSGDAGCGKEAVEEAASEALLRLLPAMSSARSVLEYSSRSSAWRLLESVDGGGGSSAMRPMSPRHRDGKVVLLDTLRLLLGALLRLLLDALRLLHAALRVPEDAISILAGALRILRSGAVVRGSVGLNEREAQRNLS